MEKIKYIFLALIGLALTLSACSDGSEINKTLEVDETKVELTHTEQSKSVAYTASKGETVMVEWKGDEWGEQWGTAVADQTTGKIVITVQENPLNSPRTASILMSLSNGWRNQVIEVIQKGNSGGDIVPDKIVFDYMGCAQSIKVQTDIETWSVSTEVAWVHIKMYPHSEELVISLDANTEYTPRATSVIVTAGAASKEVIIEQESMPLMILPYIDYNTDLSVAAMLAFERKRHNVYVGASGDHMITTPSPLFPVLRYEITRAQKVDATRMEVSAANAEILATAYPNFLIENGFQYLYSREDGVYFWLDNGPEEGTLHVIARFLPGVVNFYPEKDVIPDGPSFDVFPYPTTELAWGVNGAAIKAWEGANGGVLNEELEYAINFTVPASSDIYYRIYQFGQLEHKDMFALGSIYYDISKFYTRLGIFWRVNANLFELLINEGFEPIETFEGIIYRHKTRDLVALIMAYNSVEAEETDPPEFAGFTFVSWSAIEEAGGTSAEINSKIMSVLPPAPQGLKYVPLNLDK